ncbi:MAG: aminoacyl-tRNA hydrolase [Dehalococcoidales bacterium]|nr:aminoacyl-tRNA hydrolase [Dehalococcoidales bacterium]
MPFWNRKTETRLIVGLGNPGEKYTATRHNIGFTCIDTYAQLHNVAFARSRIKAKTAMARINNLDVVLAKPYSFMNLSGEPVGKLLRQHKVKTENLIVIHDDMDLPVGRIRIRQGGSSAGHKGINSIVEHISTQEFVRVRVGIGRPQGTGTEKENEVIDYVLGEFTTDEKPVIKDIMPIVCQVLDSLLVEGLTASMNRYNSTDLRKPNNAK